MKSGVLGGSIAALGLHEVLHGASRIAVDAVTKRNGEDRPSARDDVESGRGVAGGYDFAHTFQGYALCLAWDTFFAVGPCEG